MAEIFRNPNLLLDSITEMQIKQQAATAELKEKLNEITKIKDHLKEFKPNLSFDKVLFGQLNLNGYSSFDPFKSLILT